MSTRTLRTSEPSAVQQIWSSFRSVPLWVQLWVQVLFGANMASFFFLESSVGVAAAISIGVVMVLNMGLMVKHRGINRMMSVTHLIPWIPLQVFLGYALLGGIALEPGVATYAAVLFIINGISLALDTLESVRWFRGQTEVFGR